MNGGIPTTAKLTAPYLGGALFAALAMAMLPGGDIAQAAPADATVALTGLEDRIDGDLTVVADDEVLIDGSAALANLTEGSDYTLTATLVASDGTPLDFDDATPPTVSQAIHAEATEQLASFELAFDGSPLAASGEATVHLALSGDDVDVTAIGGGDRSVISLVKPQVSVTLVQPRDDLAATPATIGVELGIDGIVAERSYDLTVALVDETTGAPIVADPSPITTLEVTGAPPLALSHDFTLDTSSLSGGAIGAEATLTRHDRLLARARSASDDAIGIVAPSFHSTLSDGIDGDTMLTIDPQMELIDHLACRNLEPDRAYRAISLVMDCDTGAPLIVGDAADAPDEAAVREFYGKLVDAYGLRQVALADERPADEAASDDEASTTLPAPIDRDALDGLLAASADLLERISLDSVDFTPSSADETVDVTHDLDASRYGPEGESRTVTTFTLLTSGDAVVAVEAGGTDGRAVSLEPPTLSGALARDEEADDPDGIALVNTVEYGGVLTDAPYTLTTILVDGDTGEDILIDGTPVAATCDLTPSGTEGTQPMALTFDPADAPDTTLTVREELTRDDVLIARGGAREGDTGVATDDANATSSPDRGDAAGGSTYAKTGLGALPWLLGVGATGGGVAALSGWRIWRRRHRW